MTFIGTDIMARSGNYLVLVPETVIAFDLAQTISDFDGTARVICAGSISEAEQALRLVESVEIAFVAEGPTTFSGSALHAELLRRGARTVLLGVEAEVIGPTPVFDVLAQPFDTEAVLAKLQAVSPDAD